MTQHAANSPITASTAAKPSPASGGTCPLKLARLGIAFVICLLAVVLTRVPLLPPHLFSFDAVNLALSLRDFDPARDQPQPPGYPLFVLEGRALLPLLRTPERVFALLQVLVSSVSLTLLYLLGTAMFSAPVGAISAAMLLFNPPFWFSGLTSPLRPHLALFSSLVAYCCWRAVVAKEGQKHTTGGEFYLASLAFAIGGGFRPELLIILLPLWIWAAWQCGLRIAARGAILGSLVVLVWGIYLVAACGGLGRTFIAFHEYTNVQIAQSSVLEGAGSIAWRRMAGRALVWTGMGALPWIWAIPFGWRGLLRWASARRQWCILALWLVPGLAFHTTFHSGDPDHVLATVPAVCLLGGLCLHSVAPRLAALHNALLRRIHPIAWLAVFAALFFFFAWGKPDRSEMAIGVAVICCLVPLTQLAPPALQNLFLSVALLGNVLLFTGAFPFPQGPAHGQFRGLASARDAFLGAVYESSYNRVRWDSDMTEITLRELPRLKAETHRTLLLVWSRDGVPVWRKVSYYFPDERLYVLDQAGDPAVSVTRASVWSANRMVRTFTGPAPIQVPVPRGARLVWFGGGDAGKLIPPIPLRKAFTLAYGDVPGNLLSFRWKSFEFVTQ